MTDVDDATTTWKAQVLAKVETASTAEASVDDHLKFVRSPVPMSFPQLPAEVALDRPEVDQKLCCHDHRYELRTSSETISETGAESQRISSLRPKPAIWQRA